ncbi:MAG: DUF1080 domain-containing protein [Gammaproteobacteria bacterium]|jgi:hypothetical protein|nr:DUF1080 domain-containing protein [Gammaproteobacteria bacterium]
MLKQIKIFTLILLAMLVSACSMMQSSNMTTLFDGETLQNWNPIGNADWTFNDGYVEGSDAPGFLVSNQSYEDYRLIVEFWTDEPANSGIFIRCQDSQNVTDTNCYEVNIFDTRPDQTYRTGGIVNIAAPTATINAADQWNRFEIVALGSQLLITLNGTETVNVNDEQFSSGSIALQYNSGVVRFREVSIQEL